MSAAEAPKSEQIQANVAAALSRLRGELGASSSPVAGTVQKAVPKSPTEPADLNQGPNLGPLPAGPVRLAEPERSGNVIRPFEPTLGSAMGGSTMSTATAPAPAPTPTPMPAPAPTLTPTPSVAAAPAPEPMPKPELVAEPVGLPGLFARREPVLSATPADKSSAPLTIDAEPQPDLLAGVEVPPAPPPPLAALESEDEVSGRGRRMRNRLLVLVILIAIAGGGAYAYLKSQHATGPVPVITADTSPEKVKPADEGGMQVPNQNVQILDTINGQPNNDQGAEKVLPAPEQPVAPPAANDTATAEATPAPAEAPAPANDNAPTVTDQPVPTVPAPPVPSASTPAPAVSDLTQPQEAQPAAPQQPAAEATKPAETAPAATEPAAAAPTKTAEAPKPAEPAAEAPAPAKTQTAAAPAAATPTVQPAAGGSARIQLAAVKSEALAKEQWSKFQKAHPDLLGALTLSIQKVTVNGADYFRIQAGPLSDKTAAKDLCSKLKAQKQDCLVAK